MKCAMNIIIVLVTALSLVYSMPSETTTARSTPPIGDSIKKLTNQLMEINATSLDVETFDTRTPPKIKQQQKMKNKLEIENSHAGVAIPMDEDALEVEEATKKLNFYKIERPTTNSGLSTWILLGQNLATTKAPRKPVVKPNVEDRKPKPPEKQNLTMISSEPPHRLIKPLFKKRTTTRKPTSTTKISTTTPKSTTPRVTKETTKMTKIKASVLNNAVYKKNITYPSTTLVTIGTTTTTKKPSIVLKRLTTTEKPNKSTTEPMIKLENVTVNAIDSNALPLEPKDGELEISNSTDTKKKKSTTKRKKNKNRRRKPSTEEASSNSTSLNKHKISKEKPIGTQLYNYLSREVMPTVGVGLVGLMVTAGLASYFLYPFGIARRSYEIDRKDKEGSYYYSDDYSGGIAEEEAIGKVIAGMPANSLFTSTYKTPTSRNTYPNMRYRQVDHRISQIQPQQGMVKGTVETVQLTPKQQAQPNYEVNTQPQQQYDGNYVNYKQDAYQPISYNKDVMEKNQESSYAVNDRKFVVGNIPKEITEEATPAAVPEHGPRSLRFRRKRAALENSHRITRQVENELNSTFDSDDIGNDTKATTLLETTTIPTKTSTLNTTTTTESLPDKYVSFIHLMKDLIHLKVKLGLEIIQNATRSISNYVSKVQMRLDEHHENSTRNRWH